MLAYGLGDVAPALSSSATAGVSSSTVGVFSSLLVGAALMGVGSLFVLIFFLAGAVPAIWGAGGRFGTKALRAAAILELFFLFATTLSFTSVLAAATSSSAASSLFPASGLPSLVLADASLMYLGAFAGSFLVVVGAVVAVRHRGALVAVAQATTLQQTKAPP